MTGAPPPPKVLGCQRDPERWFDPHDRHDALAGCLACGARRWCAREALSCAASWGMWAGVWIDGRHAEAAPYLKAIATKDSSPADRPPSIAGGSTDPDPPPPAPLRRPRAAHPARSVNAAVLARSSGHCEVLAQGCQYGFDSLQHRSPGRAVPENCSPAEVFATCRECADIVAGLQPQLATRSGYRVNPGRDPAVVPFLWRATRWVLLDRDGWLTELRDDAQSA